MDVQPSPEPPVDSEPASAIIALPSKDSDVPIDPSDVLAYLTDQGITVNGDDVSVKADGTIAVDVDPADVKAMQAAWASYVPAPSPAEQARTSLDAVKDLDGLKAWLAAYARGVN
jgi:hypothetical protein